ncbi:hypothetical protein GCM10022221_47330 [Actinocorallia aurea]
MRIASVVAALLLTGGCAASAAEAPGGRASVAEGAAQTATSRADAYDQVPSADRRAFLAALAQADPRLVRNGPQKRRALRRAVAICSLLDEGLPAAAIVEKVSAAFTGRRADVTPAEAAALLPALRAHVCRRLG